MTNERLAQIQAVLREAGIPAWLLFNFRDTNPIANQTLGLPPEMHQTRRWVYLIPAEGAPSGMYHRIERHISNQMVGDVVGYSSNREFRDGLASMLDGYPAVAMEYSPGNALPVVAKVDAGTVELVRSFGVDVVSSGELIARLGAILSPEQLASATRAGAACRRIMLEAFGFIRDRIRSGQEVTEYDVQREILRNFAASGLETDHPANCSVGPNSANPHYEPTAEASSAIREGDFVLIDLWAREIGEGKIFGDITWVGYVGTRVPDRYEEVFQVVRTARDAAYGRVREAFELGERVTGAELDDAARDVIARAGYGSYFIHRTGHSITTELHGAGANLDNFETEDTRPILPGTSFSIEPGIYLPGDFGIRSELDVVIDRDGVVTATSEPLQTRVLPILADDYENAEG